MLGLGPISLFLAILYHSEQKRDVNYTLPFLNLRDFLKQWQNSLDDRGKIKFAK
jgi:hypothetical protein